jgi:hypothetical protein
VAAGEIEIELQAPSTLLHDRIPCLEDAQTGVVVADKTSLIESYSLRLAGKHGERDLLCGWDKPMGESSKDAVHVWARQKALEQLLLRRLHPLVHQTLFDADLFAQHTAHIYGSGLGLVSRRSLPPRLKRQLQLTYAGLAIGFECNDPLGAILREGNSEQDIKREEERQRNEIVNRAGLATGKRQATGLLEEEKKKTWKAFRRVRLEACAKELFDAIADLVADNAFVSESERPCLLDLRLFSLLAPLLLPEEEYPALARSTLPRLLRSSYPTLVQHSQRVQQMLWSVKLASRLDGTTTIETPDWPLLPNRGAVASGQIEPLSLRLAHTMGRLTSEAYIFTTRFASKLSQPTIRAADSKESQIPGQAGALSDVEQRESRMVRLGTYAWAATSLVVAIGTAFASGLIKIEFADDNEVPLQGLSGMVLHDSGESLVADSAAVSNEDVVEEIIEAEIDDDDDDTEIGDDEEMEIDLENADDLSEIDDDEDD